MLNLVSRSNKIMKIFFEKLKFIFTDEVLRKRILFIFFAFLIFRLFSSIPMPMADLDALKNFFEGSGLLGMLNIFSGGGLSALSIVMLGVMPYITAAIIMQLMPIIFPKIKEMQQEGGEIGRKKLANYARLLSIPLAAIQAIGFMALLESQNVLPNLTTEDKMFGVLIAVAGSVFLMWLGELISEFGIGNGISLIIVAGIVSALPGVTRGLYETIRLDPTQLPMYIGVLAAFLLMIYAIVYMSEAERPIPVAHAKSSRAGTKASGIRSTIPIKLNQAGVIPIIFAIALLSFPQMIVGFLQSIGKVSANLSEGSFLYIIANFSQQHLYFGMAYFALVFFFTFFYTAVTFDPKKMAENLAKSGTYVPGIRPGEDTEEYFGKVATRVTFFGAFFLATVAIMPIVVSQITGNANLIIGGISILIIVQVGIDLIRKVTAQISVREYIKSV